MPIFVCFNYTADIISTVEFNHSGELLATGDKGGRVVIFQQEQEVSALKLQHEFQFALGASVASFALENFIKDLGSF